MVEQVFKQGEVTKYRFGEGKEMNKHLMVIGVVILLLAVGLGGCEELEGLDKPDYITVTVIC